jgi:hypothetical protein
MKKTILKKRYKVKKQNIENWEEKRNKMQEQNIENFAIIGRRLINKKLCKKIYLFKKAQKWQFVQTFLQEHLFSSNYHPTNKNAESKLLGILTSM